MELLEAGISSSISSGAFCCWKMLMWWNGNVPLESTRL